MIVLHNYSYKWHFCEITAKKKKKIAPINQAVLLCEMSPH